jgi:hypothetical protein
MSYNLKRPFTPGLLAIASKKLKKEAVLDRHNHIDYALFQTAIALK